MVNTLLLVLRRYRTGLAELAGGGLIVGSVYSVKPWVAGIVGGAGLLLKALDWDLGGAGKDK